MFKMESFCLKCRRNTENRDPKISSTSKAICDSRKSRFIKHQEAKGLLSKLGIITH